MKRIFKRILKIISTSIFVVLMLIIILILFYVVRVQILTSQGKVEDVKLNFYTILTQSMYPTIDAGDIVITYKNNKDIYKTGDIITFVSTANASKGLTITHRVIEVFNLNDVYSYKTQGDNNNIADSASVPSKNVIGKVIFKVPKAGYIQQFLVTKVGWVVAIVLPCLAIIIYDILKMFKVLTGKNKKKNNFSNDNDSIKSKELLEKVINKEDDFNYSLNNNIEEFKYEKNDGYKLKDINGNIITNNEHDLNNYEELKNRNISYNNYSSLSDEKSVINKRVDSEGDDVEIL